LKKPAASSWPADAVERLGIDDIEATFAGILHEKLDPGANERGAGYGAVTVDLHQLVPVTLDALAAKTDLIVDA
jgi:hypothetical protein